MRSRGTIWKAALAAALLVAFAGGTRRALSAAREQPARLLVSVYDNEAAAADALRSLKASRDRGELVLESYALVVKEANGKVKVRDKREPGTRAGQGVAAITGMLGFRAGLGIAANLSSSLAYLTSNLIGMQKDLAFALSGMMNPGEAAVVSAVDQKSADLAARLTEAGAIRSLGHDLPSYIDVPEGRAPSTPIRTPRVVPGSP